TASFSVTTDAGVDQVQLQDTVRAELATLEDAGEVTVASAAAGFASSDILVNITSPSQEVLQEASDAVLAAMQRLEITAEASSNLEAAQPYIAVQVDREAAAAA